MKKTVLFSMFVCMSLCLVSSTYAVTLSKIVLRSSRTLNVPDDYATIQKAIDAAGGGDTIQVASGTYSEGLTLTKSGLTLQGAGSETTIIDPNSTSRDGVLVDGAKNVFITGFTVRNGQNGIELTNGSNVGLGDIIAQDNENDGIAVYFGSTAYLSGPIACNSNKGSGVELFSSSNAYFTQATATANSNTKWGFLVNSSALTLSESVVTASSNIKDGLGVYGGSDLIVMDASVLLTEQNSNRGLSVGRTSACHLGKESSVTTRNNTSFGMQVAVGSSANLDGILLVEGNGNMGILVNQGSTIWMEDTASVTVKGSTGFGVGIMLSETSSLRAGGGTVIVENNSGSYGDGVMVIRSSHLTLQGTGLSAEIRSNGGYGVMVSDNASCRLDSGTVIRNNTKDGLYANRNSEFLATDVEVKDNSGWGLSAEDGSSADCRDSTITGNTAGAVKLRFGARCSLYDNSMGTLPVISCDSTVLIRGDHACPE